MSAGQLMARDGTVHDATPDGWAYACDPKRRPIEEDKAAIAQGFDTDCSACLALRKGFRAGPMFVLTLVPERPSK